MGLFKKKKTEVVELTVEERVNQKEFTSFEEDQRDFKDFIACDYVNFAESPRYSIVGDKFVRNMYIGILPSSVSFPRFLDELYAYGDVDNSIFIEPLDNEEAIAELSKLRTNLETEYLTANGNNRRDDVRVKVEDCTRLRDEIRDGFNKIYKVSILSSIYSNTEKELENDSARLRQLLGRRDIGIKNAIYEQEEAYISNKPTMNNLINEYHTFDKRSLACVFPFTTSNINHEFGVPIGRNKDNGQPVIYDNYDRSLKNYNMVIFAQSGAGKSTFLKMLAARGSTFDDIINFSIDIEPEYNDIAEILGGMTITIAQNSSTVINFFDVTTEMVENKLNGKKREVVNLSSKINAVTSILLTMAKGFTGANQEYYNDITRTIIKDCVIQVYKDCEITNDIRSLYNDDNIQLSSSGSVIGGYTMKEMPTLSDWYEALRKKSEANSIETYNKYYHYLLATMKEFCKSTNGSFTCFDGQSTVKLTYDSPFTNFDVSQLNEETELPLAQHIIFDYIWETIIKKNDKGYKIRVILDEAWRLAKVVDGKPKFPEALVFLEKLFRRARKKNTSAVVISQQFNEFYNPETQSIIKNSDTRVFLPPDETSIEDISNVFHLTQGETAYLTKARTGEALFKCGNTSCKLNVEIPNFELAFVQTNQNAIKKV